MKKWLLIPLACVTLSLVAEEKLNTQAVKLNQSEESRIRYVNFKDVVEGSKIGKQEQAAFEVMKNQMEKVVEEKEKVLTELANKLNNIDELELMSPEAETELKRKFRALSQEMSQLQTQFYQTLSQANLQIVQKLSETVAKAAEKVSNEKGFDFILNDEGVFFAKKTLDISPLIIKEMDAHFEEEVAKPAAAV